METGATTPRSSCCGGATTTGPAAQVLGMEGLAGHVQSMDAQVTDATVAPGEADGCCAGDSTYGYADHKQDYLRRLRRIEGQVRGLQRMVEEDQYCIDILTQVSAVTKALESTALRLLDEHLAHCVTRAIEAGGQEADDKLAEASAAIARLVRS